MRSGLTVHLAGRAEQDNWPNIDYGHAAMIRHDHDELQTPCAFGLLAATVALMTRYADPAPDATIGADKMRNLLARKIVSNLFFLQHHPSVPPAFGQVMAQAHQHWVGIARQPQATHPPAVSAALH